MSQDELWMQIALAAAAEAGAAGEVPIGAVVVREGAVIATGANERERTGDPLAHAEVVALRRAADALGSWRLDDCTLVVTLEPCAMCAGAVMQSRVGRVIFGAWDDKAGAVGSTIDVIRDRSAPFTVEVRGGVAEAQCRELLTDFFRARR